jgi:flagellar biosynthesis protein FlhG
MDHELRNKLWAIGGGKGGVGKSIVTIMLGTLLARRGKKIIIVDADLGGSNLHTLVGIRYPVHTLADFISKRVESIDDVIMTTPVENLKIICGADDVLGLANPKSTQKTKIFNNLKKLDADLILLDLGAGTSFTTVDFFLYAINKLVVFTPQITSIQNAYGFIKASLLRLLNRTFRKEPECLELIRQLVSPDGGNDTVVKLKEAFAGLGEGYPDMLNNCIDELKIGLIVNMVRGSNERDVGRIVQTVASNYLGIEPDYLGHVNYDKVLSMSVNNLKDYLVTAHQSMAGEGFYDISSKMLKSIHETAPMEAVPASGQAG